MRSRRPGRSWFDFTTVVLMGGSLLVACNGLLGIGPATVEDGDSLLDATVEGSMPTPTGDATTGTDAGPPALTCQYYCATVMNNCSGPNLEYLSSDICLAMCPAFDPGMGITDSSLNTLGCRIFNAEQAATHPATSCRAAGPLGGGHCGKDPCVDFCSLDLANCSGANAAYASQTQCEMECLTYPYLTGATGDLNDMNGQSLQSGNTLNCRLWHLNNAYPLPEGADMGGDQMYHCPHTAKISLVCNNGEAGAMMTMGDAGTMDQ